MPKNSVTVVSIVMPTYNSGGYIAQSIQSVIAQSFGDWELLIVDNSSIDNTHEIVRAYAEKDDRIKLIVNQNEHSVAAARRRAIDLASGEWIAFLDSDDLWTSDKLSVQLEAAQRLQSGFLFTASAFIDREGRKKDYILPAPERIGYPEILKQDLISCSSVLVRKDWLVDCFTEHDNGISDDYAAWIRILKNRCVYATGINKPLLIYRVSQTSLSGNKLESAVRTFRTYRHTGHSVATSARYWCHYVVRSLKKYGRLYTD